MNYPNYKKFTIMNDETTTATNSTVLNTENTEDVSTTSCAKSDDLHDVSDRNAERSKPESDSEGVVEGALAKRTDKKEDFYCRNNSEGDDKCNWQCPYCFAVE